MTLIILDSVIRVHFEGIIQQQQQQQLENVTTRCHIRWTVQCDSCNTLTHASDDQTEEFVQCTKQMTNRFSFHSFKNLNIYIFLSRQSLFCPAVLHAAMFREEKKRRHTQTVYTIKNDGNFHGAHCQRKFMVVIHHYIFFSLSFRAIFVENQIMFAALIHLNVCVCVPLS